MARDPNEEVSARRTVQVEVLSRFEAEQHQCQFPEGCSRSPSYARFEVKGKTYCSAHLAKAIMATQYG